MAVTPEQPGGWLLYQCCVQQLRSVVGLGSIAIGLIVITLGLIVGVLRLMSFLHAAFIFDVPFLPAWFVRASRPVILVVVLVVVQVVVVFVEGGLVRTNLLLGISFKQL